MSPAEYKEARVMLGYTQDQLAKILDVRRETIARRETGKGEIVREAELAVRWLLRNRTEADELNRVTPQQHRTQPEDYPRHDPESPLYGKAPREPIFGGMLKAPRK